MVYGQRRLREGESLFKRATAAAFYRVIGRMTDVEIPSDTGDFRLMTRRGARPAARHARAPPLHSRHGGVDRRPAGAAAVRPQGARRRRDQVSADQDGALRRRRDHRLLGGAADGLDDHRLDDGRGRLRLLRLFDRRFRAGLQPARLDVADGRDRPAGRHAVPDAGHHRRLSRQALRPEQGPAAVHDPRHRRRPASERRVRQACRAPTTAVSTIRSSA